eukprot:295295_1
MKKPRCTPSSLFLIIPSVPPLRFAFALPLVLVALSFFAFAVALSLRCFLFSWMFFLDIHLRIITIFATLPPHGQPRTDSQFMHVQHPTTIIVFRRCFMV